MDASIAVADHGFSPLAQQMSRWVEQVLGSEYRVYHAERGWSPSINLYEDEGFFYLVADLAGVDAEKVDLRVEKGKLLLRGERAGPRPPGRKDCPVPNPGTLRLHLMEIDHGPFLRVLEVPEFVDTDGICACYRNGFLWVKMPKKG